MIVARLFRSAVESRKTYFNEAVSVEIFTMNEVLATEINWIETYLVPKITESLGKDKENVYCKVSIPENCFFLSYVCFVDLIFANPDNKDEKDCENILRVVMKKPPLNDVIVERMDMTKHFHNEILFYTKFANANPRFPSYVFGNNETLENTVIVTKNISVDGYNVCPEPYDIPFEYVLSAVSEIGKLHAIGYVMKENEPEKFYNIISDIQEPRFTVDSWISIIANLVASRPVDWLRKNNYDPEFCNKIEKYLNNSYEKIMLTAMRPVEPLATLCHGDFTRNNIFFRKSNDKLEAMLFDFAVIIYGSPAIDLSTFLFLNVSAEDRTERFNEIYRSYHNSLIEYLRDAGIDDLEKYSYEKMLADYKRYAAFGYIISVYFAPVMRGVCSVELSEAFKDLPKCAMLIRESGGETLTKMFAEMILELRDFGCFDNAC